MARNGGASAREQARRLQQEQERKRKLQSLLLRIGVVVVALAVVVGLTFYVVTREDNGSYTEGPAPAAANEQGGIVLTSSTELAEGDDLSTVDSEEIDDALTVGSAGDLPPGVEPREEGEPPHVVIYTDAGCPGCGSFEQQNHQILMEWLDAGAITLEYRSVDYQLPYSARAANAFFCMAEEYPEHYGSFLGSVTAERAQGAEYSNDELAARAESDYGVDISQCIADGDYRAMVNYTTTLASANGVSGTPYVYVNGEFVEDLGATAQVILAAVEEYQEELGEDLVESPEEDLEDIDDEDAPEQSDAEDADDDE
ncbi:thioredoxin domain-containing protein [Nesterenkonia muleiensis]|uniref:thioredoxin domain-containing protein n=1 Tax=Nesterenkonia muleiensis TaxID=2282648 RepID=UPI00130087CF|nr:thioredoxin domain-containing protein [Nesterenkonia muleiensis]